MKEGEGELYMREDEDGRPMVSMRGKKIQKKEEKADVEEKGGKWMGEKRQKKRKKMAKDEDGSPMVKRRGEKPKKEEEATTEGEGEFYMTEAEDDKMVIRMREKKQIQSKRGRRGSS